MLLLALRGIIAVTGVVVGLMVVYDPSRLTDAALRRSRYYSVFYPSRPNCYSAAALGRPSDGVTTSLIGGTLCCRWIAG